MAYMGINDYSNILSNYTTPVIPQYRNAQGVDQSTQLQDISSKAVAPDTNVEEGNHIEPVEAGNTFRVRNINIHDVALKFNANDDFSYIGRDVDIENLDMQKAVSDMKKDGILSQYQFFVGTSVGL